MITKQERAALNALALKGMHDTAICVERLLMQHETVVKVEIFGAVSHITIIPPSPASPLWRGAETSRSMNAETDYFTVRSGCSIRWTITRAEAELLRITQSSREVH